MNLNGACPKCKSANIVRAGKALRRGGKVQSYKCSDCGHAFTEDKRVVPTIIQERVVQKHKKLIDKGHSLI